MSNFQYNILIGQIFVATSFITGKIQPLILAALWTTLAILDKVKK